MVIFSASSSPVAGAKIIYFTDYPASIHATGFFYIYPSSR